MKDDHTKIAFYITIRKCESFNPDIVDLPNDAIVYCFLNKFIHLFMSFNCSSTLIGWLHDYVKILHSTIYV